MTPTQWRIVYSKVDAVIDELMEEIPLSENDAIEAIGTHLRDRRKWLDDGGPSDEELDRREEEFAEEERNERQR